MVSKYKYNIILYNIIIGNSLFNIDFDKFVGIIVFCAVESKYLVDESEQKDCFKKVRILLY